MNYTVTRVSCDPDRETRREFQHPARLARRKSTSGGSSDATAALSTSAEHPQRRDVSVETPLVQREDTAEPTDVRQWRRWKRSLILRADFRRKGELNNAKAPEDVTFLAFVYFYRLDTLLFSAENITGFSRAPLSSLTTETSFGDVPRTFILSGRSLPLLGEVTEY